MLNYYIKGEDYIDLGAATLDFYSSLVDLLAKCAPDPLTIQVRYFPVACNYRFWLSATMDDQFPAA